MIQHFRLIPLLLKELVHFLYFAKILVTDLLLTDKKCL